MAAEDVRNIFQEFKNVDENLHPYLHLLRLLDVNSKNKNVIDSIVSY